MPPPVAVRDEAPAEDASGGIDAGGFTILAPGSTGSDGPEGRTDEAPVVDAGAAERDEGFSVTMSCSPGEIPRLESGSSGITLVSGFGGYPALTEGMKSAIVEDANARG